MKEAAEAHLAKAWGRLLGNREWETDFHSDNPKGMNPANDCASVMEADPSPVEPWDDCNPNQHLDCSLGETLSPSLLASC